MMRDEYLKDISEAYVIDRNLPSDKVSYVYELLKQFREDLMRDDDLYFYLCDVKKYALHEYLYTYLDLAILYEWNISGLFSKLLYHLGDVFSSVAAVLIPKPVLHTISSAMSRLSGLISRTAIWLHGVSKMWMMHEVIIFNNAESCYKRCGVPSSEDVPKFSMLTRGLVYHPDSVFETVRKTIPCLVDCYCNLVLDTISILAQEFFTCLKNNNVEGSVRGNFRTVDDIYSITRILGSVPECSVYGETLRELVESYIVFIEQYYRSIEWPGISDDERQQIKRKYNEATKRLITVLADAYSASMRDQKKQQLPSQKFPREEERKMYLPDINKQKEGGM